MGAVRDLWNLGAPWGPAAAKNWGEAASDRIDLAVGSTDIDTIVVLTQAEYDALGTYDPDTLYVIEEA